MYNSDNKKKRQRWKNGTYPGNPHQRFMIV